MPTKKTGPRKQKKEEVTGPNRYRHLFERHAEVEPADKGPEDIEIREKNAIDWLDNRMPSRDLDWDTIDDCIETGVPIPKKLVLDALEFIRNYPTELYRIGMNHAGFGSIISIVIEGACRESMDCFDQARRVLVYTARRIDRVMAEHLDIGLERLFKVYAPRGWYGGAEDGLLYPRKLWATLVEDPENIEINELAPLLKAIKKLETKISEEKQETLNPTLRQGATDLSEAVLMNETSADELCSIPAPKHSDPITPEMMSITEAAQYAGVTERTIRTWLTTKTGDMDMLPGVIRNGKIPRIPRASIDPWKKKPPKSMLQKNLSSINRG